MAQKKKFKWDIKKIILAILIVAVIIGVATGRISLSELLGIDIGTQQAATGSGELQTPADTGEAVNILPGCHQRRNLLFHLCGKNVLFNIINAGKHPEHIPVYRSFPFPVGHAEDGAGGVVANAF